MRSLIALSVAVLVLSVSLGLMHSWHAAAGAAAGTLLTALPAIGVFAALRFGLSPINAALALTAGRLMLLLLACLAALALLDAAVRKPFLLAMIVPYLVMLVADSVLIVRETKRLEGRASASPNGAATEPPPT